MVCISSCALQYKQKSLNRQLFYCGQTFIVQHYSFQYDALCEKGLAMKDQIDHYHVRTSYLSVLSAKAKAYYIFHMLVLLNCVPTNHSNMHQKLNSKKHLTSANHCSELQNEGFIMENFSNVYLSLQDSLACYRYLYLQTVSTIRINHSNVNIV